MPLPVYLLTHKDIVEICAKYEFFKEERPPLKPTGLTSTPELIGTYDMSHAPEKSFIDDLNARVFPTEIVEVLRRCRPEDMESNLFYLYIFIAHQYMSQPPVRLHVNVKLFMPVDKLKITIGFEKLKVHVELKNKQSFDLLYISFANWLREKFSPCICFQNGRPVDKAGTAFESAAGDISYMIANEQTEISELIIDIEPFHPDDVSKQCDVEFYGAFKRYLKRRKGLKVKKMAMKILETEVERRKSVSDGMVALGVKFVPVDKPIEVVLKHLNIDYLESAEVVVLQNETRTESHEYTDQDFMEKYKKKVTVDPRPMNDQRPL